MDFDTLIDYVLTHEGGYVFDPNDPGGETNFGISKRQYPDVDIKLLSKAAAKEIYHHDYWMKIKGPELPTPLKLSVLDSAINMGVFRASAILQESLGVDKDGIIGKITIKALEGLDPHNVVYRFSILRLKFYQSIPGWKYYSRGWSRRVLDVALTSTLLCGGEKPGQALPWS